MDPHCDVGFFLDLGGQHDRVGLVWGVDFSTVEMDHQVDGGAVVSVLQGDLFWTSNWV